MPTDVSRECGIQRAMLTHDESQTIPMRCTESLPLGLRPSWKDGSHVSFSTIPCDRSSVFGSEQLSCRLRGSVWRLEYVVTLALGKVGEFKKIGHVTGRHDHRDEATRQPRLTYHIIGRIKRIWGICTSDLID